MQHVVSGTEGYAEEAPELLRRYENAPISAVHRAILDFFPAPPADILDIGAGTGRDAAAFADMGHAVVAVEPVREMREGAQRLHPSSRILWLDDSLPELTKVHRLARRFDFVGLTAVWMHLDVVQRARAMTCVAPLVAPKGHLGITLRHGPVPLGRRMFDVRAEETVAQAKAGGLCLRLNRREESVGALNRAQGVFWTRLLFQRTGASA